MKAIQLVSKVIGKILEVLIAYLLAQMSVLMALQLLVRHFPILPNFFWAEELARFSMAAIIFLGAAISSRYRDHIAVTFFEEILKGKARIILKLFVSMLSIVFLSVLVKYGFMMLPSVSRQVSATLQMPMSWIYAMIPIGACLMLFYVLIEVVELIMSLTGKGEKKA